MAHDQDARAELLETLERLLASEAMTLERALNDAAQSVAQALRADKVDAFILNVESDTLVAVGVSDTPMGRRQRAIGMDRLPLANGGRMVEVYQCGASFMHGQADEDPCELRGIIDGLGVRSTIATPLPVGDEQHGVLAATSASPNFFGVDDLRYLEAVARWVGTLAHRGELVEQISEEALERGRQVVAEELVTMLAHDLRNHITPLKGRLDLLRRRALREERASDVRDIGDASAAVARFEALIEDLLDVGRLESGMFAIDLKAVDVVALVRETAQELDTPGNQVRVDAPAEAIACVDAARVRQALENLLSNASRHAPEGTPVSVRVRLTGRSDRAFVTVTISDQGPGISPELLPRIFGRFVSGPSSTGLGLGLYMASRIATAHGGSLSVDSRPGSGASFHLSLPVGEPFE